MSQPLLPAHLTNERTALIAQANEAVDRLHTNAMQILIAHAQRLGVTDLILAVEENTESGLWPQHVTIDGTTYSRDNLPSEAEVLTQAAFELPAFTQHSFTDYLIDLPGQMGDDDIYVPMRVDLARAAADYGMTA